MLDGSVDGFGWCSDENGAVAAAADLEWQWTELWRRAAEQQRGRMTPDAGHRTQTRKQEAGSRRAGEQLSAD